MVRAAIFFLAFTIAATARADLPIPSELARLSCAACLTAEQARQRFTGEEWQLLEKGESVTKEGVPAGTQSSEQRDTAAFGILAFPIQRVWDVLVDFAARAKFMTNSTKSQITAIDGSDVHVDQELKILWETIRFSVVNRVDPSRGVIDWHIDKDKPHDIADNTGSWQVVPLDPGRTLLMYRSRTESGRAVPEVVEQYLIKRSLPKVIEAVRDETEKRGKSSSNRGRGDAAAVRSS